MQELTTLTVAKFTEMINATKEIKLSTDNNCYFKNILYSYVTDSKTQTTTFTKV